MSTADTAAPMPPRPWLALDRLGLVVLAIAAGGAFLPFALFRANRIVLGEGRTLFEALPATQAGALAALVALCLVAALLRVSPRVKLVAGLAALAGLLVLVGAAADHLTPPGDNFARVSPGSGFWLLLAAFALLVTDALARLRPGPALRVAILLAVAAALWALLAGGVWSDLSIMREYGSRAPAFWREGRTHLLLAFGSLAAASIIGIPLGILCHRLPPARAAFLNVLNVVQTIPSIALFGLLIAPLAWVAANVPGASALGVSGIGIAPAMVALLAYSLLPVVSNTLAGLGGVPRTAVDAARGMGMTGTQRLLKVELPLAFPVILAGIRIVLVQNIGLATVAALIGGGGFGVFVFQGIGQTASDLVLLGAVPTIALAFAAAVILDALVEASNRRETRA